MIVLSCDPSRDGHSSPRNNKRGRVWCPKRRCFCLLRVRPLMPPQPPRIRIHIAPYTDRLLLSSQRQSGHFEWLLPCHPFHTVNIAFNYQLRQEIHLLILIWTNLLDPSLPSLNLNGRKPKKREMFNVYFVFQSIYVYFFFILRTCVRILPHYIVGPNFASNFDGFPPEHRSIGSKIHSSDQRILSNPMQSELIKGFINNLLNDLQIVRGPNIPIKYILLGQLI